DAKLGLVSGLAEGPVFARFLGGRFLGGRFLGGRFLGSRFLGSRFLGSRFLGRHDAYTVGQHGADIEELGAGFFQDFLDAHSSNLWFRMADLDDLSRIFREVAARRSPVTHAGRWGARASKVLGC